MIVILTVIATSVSLGVTSALLSEPITQESIFKAQPQAEGFGADYQDWYDPQISTTLIDSLCYPLSSDWQFNYDGQVSSINQDCGVRGLVVTSDPRNETTPNDLSSVIIRRTLGIGYVGINLENYTFTMFNALDLSPYETQKFQLKMQWSDSNDVVVDQLLVKLDDNKAGDGFYSNIYYGKNLAGYPLELGLPLDGQISSLKIMVYNQQYHIQSDFDQAIVIPGAADVSHQDLTLSVEFEVNAAYENDYHPSSAVEWTLLRFWGYNLKPEGIFYGKKPTSTILSPNHLFWDNPESEESMYFMDALSCDLDSDGSHEQVLLSLYNDRGRNSVAGLTVVRHNESGIVELSSQFLVSPVGVSGFSMGVIDLELFELAGGTKLVAVAGSYYTGYDVISNSFVMLAQFNSTDNSLNLVGQTILYNTTRTVNYAGLTSANVVGGEEDELVVATRRNILNTGESLVFDAYKVERDETNEEGTFGSYKMVPLERKNLLLSSFPKYPIIRDLKSIPGTDGRDNLVGSFCIEDYLHHGLYILSWGEGSDLVVVNSLPFTTGERQLLYHFSVSNWLEGASNNLIFPVISLINGSYHTNIYITDEELRIQTNKSLNGYFDNLIVADSGLLIPGFIQNENNYDTLVFYYERSDHSLTEKPLMLLNQTREHFIRFSHLLSISGNGKMTVLGLYQESNPDNYLLGVVATTVILKEQFSLIPLAGILFVAFFSMVVIGLVYLILQQTKLPPSFELIVTPTLSVQEIYYELEDQFRRLGVIKAAGDGEQFSSESYGTSHESGPPLPVPQPQISFNRMSLQTLAEIKLPNKGLAILLLLLKRYPSKPIMSDFSTFLNIKPNNTSRTIDYLEKKGLALRGKSITDMRETQVTLTELGVDYLYTIYFHLRDYFNEEERIRKSA